MKKKKYKKKYNTLGIVPKSNGKSHELSINYL
jgi:hypothetical protein